MKPEEIRDDRQMISLTGLSLKQRAELTTEFKKDSQEAQQERYIEDFSNGARQHRLGGGQNQWQKNSTRRNSGWHALFIEVLDARCAQFHLAAGADHGNSNFFAIFSSKIARLQRRPYRPVHLRAKNSLHQRTSG